MSNKRERIIEAARARFRYYGIQKTTMQEIANDASVAVGTLYRYFKDKDDLFVACIDGFISHHQQQIDAVRESDLRADEKIRRYVLERYHVCREVGTDSRHAAELAREVLRLRPERLQQEGEMMHNALRELLTLGVEEGVFHCQDVERDARVFLFSLAWFFPNALTNIQEWPAVEDLLLVVDWFLEKWSAFPLFVGDTRREGEEE